MERVQENLWRCRAGNGKYRYLYRRQLRVNKNGERKYRDIRKTLVGSLQGALAEAKRLDEQLDAYGRGEKPPGVVSLGVFHDWYVGHLRDERRLLGWYTIIGHTRAFAGHAGLETRLDRITRADIEDFLSARRRRAGPCTVDGYLRSVRRLFNVAIQRGYLERNPTAGIRTEKPRRTEPRLPGMEELGRLLDYLKTRRPRMYPIVAALIYTGARLGEVLSLDWSRVDFTSSRLTLARRKVNDELQLIMAKPLGEVLYALWMDAGMPKEGWVFLGKTGGPLNRHCTYLSFKKAAKVLGMPWMTLKTFRKLAATWVVQSTHDVRAAQMLLGHTNLRTTEGYLGAGAEARELAVRAIEKRMSGS